MKPSLQGLLGLSLSAMTVLAGCSSSSVPEAAISHVHGLAFDPTQGAVYVATHHGLARGEPGGKGWTWQYVGPDRYDYMGFTQDALRQGTFYSSGHPDDPRAFGGVHLGLRRSTDAGQSWEQRSLKGEVDFHALTSLESGEGHLAGFWRNAVKVSRDGGLTWQDHAAAPAPIFALASSNGTLWAGTQAGLWKTTDLANWTDASGGRFTGVITSVAVSQEGGLVLVGTGDGRSGSTYRSADAGNTWAQLGPDILRDAAAPVIFAVDPSNEAHVFASTAGAVILESMDAGGSWTVIRQA